MAPEQWPTNPRHLGAELRAPKVGESRRLGAIGVGVSPAQWSRGVGVADAESAGPKALRPMSHLQLSRAILSRERVARVFNSRSTLFLNRALFYSVQLF